MKRAYLRVGIGLFAVLLATAVMAQYPEKTIREIQYVAKPDSNDDSIFKGDTLRVVGIAMNEARDLAIGQRWAIFIQDTSAKGEPWSGLLIVQHDSTVTATGMTAIRKGDVVRFTGRVAEFPTGATQTSATQFEIITNPPIPVEFIDFGRPLPEPVILNADSLDDAPTAEKWESMLVRVNDAEVVNNQLAGGTQMSVTDATGKDFIVDDFFRKMTNLIAAGQYRWPPPGTRVNLTGIVRDINDYWLLPRTPEDVEVLSAAPVITNWTRTPPAPTSTDSVKVLAQMVDPDGNIASASLLYSVNDGPFVTVAMTSPDSVYTGTIPPQSDGAFVKYFLKGVDNLGKTSIIPVDTSAGMFFYYVRDAALTIRDLQWTPFRVGDSGYRDLEVTVSGIVTTNPEDFPGGYYFIQDSSAKWNGIEVRDTANQPNRGDHITITGTVRENFGNTRIASIRSYTVNSTGNPLPEPVKVKTGQVRTGGPHAEAYEGVLIRLDSLTVTNPFPDNLPGNPRNFGEFVVDDGTGGLRVDDSNNANRKGATGFFGNWDSTFAAGDKIQTLMGILYFSFDSTKVRPRNYNDVIGHVTGVHQTEIGKNTPLEYALKAIYPNPFNPSVTIQYKAARAGCVKLIVYNLLGQKVKTLLDGFISQGSYATRWDGTSEDGEMVASGIYLVQLRADQYIQTRKVTLVR